jgi:hypothetical protein
MDNFLVEYSRDPFTVVFRLPVLPFEVMTFVHWLLRSVPAYTQEFRASSGERLSGCRLSFAVMVGEAPADSLANVNVRAWPVGDRSRHVPVGRLQVLSLGAHDSQVRFRITEPGSLGFFCDLVNLLAYSFPQIAQEVEELSRELAKVVADIDPALLPSTAGGPPLPGLPPRPAVLPEPAGQNLDEWFAWRAAMQATGHRIPLRVIARKTGFSYGHIRNEHANWTAEHGPA